MKINQQINDPTDIIVIGAGASGLSAAVTAAEGGAKVLLLEKTGHIGGSSNFAEGMFAVESDIQRRNYINYSRDEAFRAIMNYSHWRANPRLVRAFVDESGGTIRWLEKQGVEFIEPAANMPDGLRTWHILKGPLRAMGSTMVKKLTERARGLGVDIKLSAGAEKILKENSRITGVIADIGGKPRQISARAVVIGSGGYGNNREWIKKYTGFDLGENIIPIASVDKVGDGIRMAWEVGAAEEGMGVLHFFRVGPMGPGVPLKGHLECAVAQPDLWVNQRGERFCDEGISFNDTFEGNAIARLKEGRNYTLFDEAAKQQMMENGIDRSVAYKNLPGTRLVNFDKELETALQKGNRDVFAAGTIEELAHQLGIDPAVLQATVEEYNRYCETGHDRLFVKDPKYLRPIKTPRFYAIKAYTVFLGSLGGIKVNHNLEVLDNEERVIPGLYAVGTDVGGLYGDSYNFQYSSGSTLGFAVNSGRIAGRSAAKYVSG